MAMAKGNQNSDGDEVSLLEEKLRANAAMLSNLDAASRLDFKSGISSVVQASKKFKDLKKLKIVRNF